ncbi:TetR/AcrR family transcriptional regulator [Nocardia sp. NPDC058379]|uniref:TetR/AcrR family transcriptional regulator n=1 Tax=unclassified Nocardia TaxID=2637762 RepID=UPI00364698A2
MPPKGTHRRKQPGQLRRQPSQDRAKETRDLILDTAAELFGSLGVAQTSTNRIAAEAGVSIGTLYRYFADRSVIVDELLDRLLADLEQGFTARAFEFSGSGGDASAEYCTRIVSEILGIFSDILVANSALLRALIGGVQFYSTGLPQFEQRLRLLVKVVLIQGLGPADDGYLDTVTFVFINTGFAAVVRAAAVEVSAPERADAIAMTARMMGTWLAAEVAERERADAQAARMAR